MLSNKSISFAFAMKGEFASKATYSKVANAPHDNNQS
jgi:hypothetical protein